MKAGDKEKWPIEALSSLLAVAETVGMAQVIKCEDYSDLQRLLKVTALVLKFTNIVKSLSRKDVKPQIELTSQDIAVAETLWIKEIQRSLKQPILLDKNHHITSVIVRDSHKRVMHSGVKETLTELRARFWIIQGRQFVRKLLYHCVVYCKLEGRPYQAPPPPPLPEFRVKEEPPFTYVGLDFAGPLYVKNPNCNSPQQKVWICLYTCCVT